MKKYQKVANNYSVFNVNSENHNVILSKKFNLKDGFSGGDNLNMTNCVWGVNSFIDALPSNPLNSLKFRNVSFNNSKFSSYVRNVFMSNCSYYGSPKDDKGFADLKILGSFAACTTSFFGKCQFSFSRQARFDIHVVNFDSCIFRVFDDGKEAESSIFLSSAYHDSRFQSCKFEYKVFNNVIFHRCNFRNCESGDYHFLKNYPAPAFKNCTFVECGFDSFQSIGDTSEKKAIIFQNCTFKNCHEFKTIDKARFKNCKWE